MRRRPGLLAGRSWHPPFVPAMMRRGHVRWWLSIVVTTVVIATAGYVALLGWSVSDSL